jgi:hypothetical protein
MYVDRQTQILKEIAVRNGVSYGEVLKILDVIGRTINSVITADADIEAEAGIVDIDKLKCISIKGFGKFYPKKGFLKHRNEARKIYIENKKNGEL